MNKLIPRISGYGDYTRVYAQTHVYKLGVCKGSQWAILNPTDVCACAYKGPPCVQSNSYSLISLILRWIDLAVEINLCCRLSM